MSDLILVEPSKEYEKQALEYRQEYIDYFSVRVNDNTIVGTIQLRHRLTDELSKCGGHIGYGIRPSERKKGYGTQQLDLVLMKAKQLCIPKVMISCDEDNIASAKVAQKNGGILEWEGFNEKVGTEIQTYWIEVDPKGSPV